MTIDFLKEKNILIMQVSGEIDHRYASDIRERADEKIVSSVFDVFIADLSNVNFMDSSGVGMILGRYKLVKSYGSDFILISRSVSIDKILEMSGIKKIIPVYNDLLTGINSLGEEGK